MNSARTITITILFILILVAPSAAFAQTYQPDADEDVIYESVLASDGFYTFEAPEGWTVDAGGNTMFYQPLPVFLLTSPDERSSIYYGLFIPRVFVEPNAQYARGETVEVQGVNAEVRAYVDAETYYAEYIEGNLITFEDCVEEPTVTVEPVSEMDFDTSAFPGTFDAVSIYYVCQTAEGDTDVADIYYRQYRVEVEGVGSVWLVDAYVAYIAPEDEQAQVYAITEHVVSTLQVDAEWVQNYQLEEYGNAFAEATELSGLVAGIHGSR
jgi:hypothetical protein